ncbi:response regulator [Candidatus Parcubacteria bacterium]|nr:response regulator [Candidatus Parcubacteria bacterium]
MKKKILIVEDEKILAEMYKEKFEGENFEVFLAVESKEVLDIAKKEKPDLILLDILLPKESGLSLLKQIKSDPEISQIPVLAFSNYDEPKTKKEALALGVSDYLIKTDYTPRQIVEKVKSYFK